MYSKFPFAESDSRAETIVIPGIGDSVQFQKQRNYLEWLNRSRPHDALLHIFDPKWFGAESATDKRSRFLDFVSSHPNAKNGYAISGGAGLLMSCSVELPADFTYAFVCGYLKNPESVNEVRRQKATALEDTVKASHDIISNNAHPTNMVCYTGYMDGVLKQNDMSVVDRPKERIPMLGHVPAIVYAYARILPRV